MLPTMIDRLSARFASPASADAARLLLRVTLGGVFLFHGIQKITVFGVEGLSGFLGSLGVPLPTLFAYLVMGTETLGGLLLLLGLLTRLVSVPLAVTMVVACLTAHWGAFDAAAGGMEYPLTLIAVLVALALLGPGRVSLDHLLFRRDAAAPTA